MDNGPEMIAWALRDYFRLAGTRTAFIEPRSPWENPFVESFNRRARDDLFKVEGFATLLDAKWADPRLSVRAERESDCPVAGRRA